jgi:hypothetical protein
MRCHAVWLKITNILVASAASTFSVEQLLGSHFYHKNEGSTFLQNVGGKEQADYIASHSRRQYLL